MRLRQHVIASIIFSTLFFMVFKSWTISAVSFFSGILIDLDHVIDYYWEHRKRLRFNEFFDSFYQSRNFFFGTIFHSWELLLLLNLYAFFVSGNSWIIGIAIGFAQHIVLDDIFNKDTSRLKYFFFWRLRYGFNAKRMFPDCEWDV